MPQPLKMLLQRCSELDKRDELVHAFAQLYTDNIPY
jgi:hypothetical protein